MRSTCTQLSDITEVSSTSSLQSIDSLSPPPDQSRIPVIEIEAFDETPFAESFSGILDYSGNLSISGSRYMNELSYNVDRITDIRDVDSEWEDDDIDEIVIISCKTKPRASDPKRLLNNVFSLSQLHFLHPTKIPSDVISRSHSVKLNGDTSTSRVYILKAFPATQSLNWPFELRLLETLTEQGCPFFSCILRRFFEHQSLFILLDSYPAGTIMEYVLQRGALRSVEVLFYTSEITEAISVLHDTYIEHCDINPSNVMINSDGHIVLTGFEYARFGIVRGDKLDKSPPVHYPSREYEYRAPEVLLRWQYDSSVDVWGLGCLMYFMVFGKHPFSLAGKKQAQVYKRILRGGALDVEMAGSMSIRLDLIFKCLERNPHLRPDIENVKRHEYFTLIDWSVIQLKQTKAPYLPFTSTVASPCEVFDPNPVVTDSGIDTPEEADIMTPNIATPEEVEILTLDTKTDTHEKAGIATLDTNTEWDPSASTTSSQEKSAYSVQARHQVQDLLPTIFRSPSLDKLKLKMKMNETETETNTKWNLDAEDRIQFERRTTQKFKDTKASLESKEPFSDISPHDYDSGDQDHGRDCEDHSSVYKSLRMTPTIVLNSLEHQSLPLPGGARRLGSSSLLSAADFWDSVDADAEKDRRMDKSASKPARVLGVGLGTGSSHRILRERGRGQKIFSGVDPHSHRHLTMEKPEYRPGLGLRRRRSSFILQKVNDKLARLVQNSSNRLTTSTPELRRPKSTPALTTFSSSIHQDVIMKSGRKEGEYELPNGIKQIGNGIGFTYKVPSPSSASVVKVKAKASVSARSVFTPGSVAVSVSSPRKRFHSPVPPGGGGIGLGLGLAGILNKKTSGSTLALNSEELKRTIDGLSLDRETLSWRGTRMTLLKENIASGVEHGIRVDATAETGNQMRDAFSCGSTWSLMPDHRCHSPCCLDQISPVTATDSTAYSPLFEI
ncbi:hypothetical protein D9757_012455 [Collybiopsis confluens]|uniref:Protein kinase domain-containing protein n=1 Tax=Collybiopsis confluens TaxID=2823264 RepID=A0A8H5D507_9AGAR|nr:hypothetical protein D9757_012455 [Collybiopsis confluens]